MDCLWHEAVSKVWSACVQSTKSVSPFLHTLLLTHWQGIVSSGEMLQCIKLLKFQAIFEILHKFSPVSVFCTGICNKNVTITLLYYSFTTTDASLFSPEVGLIPGTWISQRPLASLHSQFYIRQRKWASFYTSLPNYKWDHAPFLIFCGVTSHCFLH